jgi:hypothetical protein
MNILIRVGDNLIYMAGIEPATAADLARGFVLTSEGVPVGGSAMKSLLAPHIRIQPPLELDEDVAPLKRELEAEMNRQKNKELHDLSMQLSGLRKPQWGPEQ